MSSILLSQSMALATAMAVSGTVIILAFRLQKSNSSSSSSSSTPHYPPSCIISSDNEKKKKKKKKVRFAEDVVDPIGNSDEYRKLRTSNNTSINSPQSHSLKKGGKLVQQIMPPNRVALYKGMLKDKVIPKVAYSY